MFKTFANAWKIPELRKKILFTALIVLIFRVGSAIPVPFTNILIEGGNLVQDGSTFLNYLIMMTGDGFTGRREGVEIKDVIGVDTAKDDKFACGFHNQYSRKARHRNPVAHALLFFIMLSLGPSPIRIAHYCLMTSFNSTG